jgi:hypothetical protein
VVFPFAPVGSPSCPAGELDQGVEGVGLTGLVIACGSGGTEVLLDDGLQRRVEPGAGVGGASRREVPGPLAVAVSAQAPRRVDAAVGGVGVGVGRRLDPGALVAQLGQAHALGSLEEAPLFVRVERRRAGDRLGLGLAQRASAEGLGRRRQRTQAFGGAQRRLSPTHGGAGVVGQEAGRRAITAGPPDIRLLHPLGQERASGHPDALDGAERLQHRQRVRTAEATGLEFGQDAPLGRHRRLQLVEHRHRFPCGQTGLTQRDRLEAIH